MFRPRNSVCQRRNLRKQSESTIRKFSAIPLCTVRCFLYSSKARLQKDKALTITFEWTIISFGRSPAPPPPPKPILATPLRIAAGCRQTERYCPPRRQGGRGARGREGDRGAPFPPAFADAPTTPASSPSAARPPDSAPPFAPENSPSTKRNQGRSQDLVSGGVRPPPG